MTRTFCLQRSQQEFGFIAAAVLVGTGCAPTFPHAASAQFSAASAQPYKVASLAFLTGTWRTQAPEPGQEAHRNVDVPTGCAISRRPQPPGGGWGHRIYKLECL